MPSLPDDFMAGVWERAGALAGRRERRMRAALFATLAMVGLGTGIGTVQAPALAAEPRYAFADDARLSPTALLHAYP